MSNLNLRQAIINRVQDKNETELHDVIESSIMSDERALPGLGVLFEIIWQHLDAPEQDQLVNKLKTHLPHP